MTKSLLFYDEIIFSLMGCILRLSRTSIDTLQKYLYTKRKKDMSNTILSLENQG